MAPHQQPLRILCLHGGSTSGTVVSLQISGFIQAFGDSAEFEDIDGPLPAAIPPPEDILAIFGDDEEYFDWFHFNIPEMDQYTGWEKSLEYLEKHIEDDGPFDAIIGFSQGAIMASLMTAHFIQKNHVPYKAIILVSGLWPQDGMPSGMPVDENTGKTQLNFPSFHILGEEDYMYEVGKEQVEHFPETSRYVYTHPFGHRFPPMPQCKDLYLDLVQKLHQVCGNAI